MDGSRGGTKYWLFVFGSVDIDIGKRGTVFCGLEIGLDIPVIPTSQV